MVGNSLSYALLLERATLRQGVWGHDHFTGEPNPNSYNELRGINCLNSGVHKDRPSPPPAAPPPPPGRETLTLGLQSPLQTPQPPSCSRLRSNSTLGLLWIHRRLRAGTDDWMSGQWAGLKDL